MPSPAASRRNLQNARQCGQIKLWRCRDETALIKLLIWQAYFEAMDSPQPSQRQLARQLRVSQPYVCKVMKKAHAVGWDALIKCERRITLDDLAEARRFTAKVRDMEPDLLAPAPQPRASDEPRAEPQPSNPYRVMAHAKTLREWQELERRGRRRGGWFRW